MRSGEYLEYKGRLYSGHYQPNRSMASLFIPGSEPRLEDATMDSNGRWICRVRVSEISRIFGYSVVAKWRGYVVRVNRVFDGKADIDNFDDPAPDFPGIRRDRDYWEAEVPVESLQDATTEMGEFVPTGYENGIMQWVKVDPPSGDYEQH